MKCKSTCLDSSLGSDQNKRWMFIEKKGNLGRHGEILVSQETITCQLERGFLTLADG